MNVDLSKFSLIWPDEAASVAHYSGKDAPAIDMFVLSELGLDEILHLKNSDLSEYFTENPAVIAHRMDVFEDMLAYPELAATLNHLLHGIMGIMGVVRMDMHVRKYALILLRF